MAGDEHEAGHVLSNRRRRAEACERGARPDGAALFVVAPAHVVHGVMKPERRLDQVARRALRGRAVQLVQAVTKVGKIVVPARRLAPGGHELGRKWPGVAICPETSDHGSKTIAEFCHDMRQPRSSQEARGRRSRGVSPMPAKS
jgi:hypothetical protein